MKQKQPKITEDFLKVHGAEVFASSRSGRLVAEDEWRKAEDNYNSRFGSRERNTSDILLGQFRLFIPKTFNTIQRILADMMDAIFFDTDELIQIKNMKVGQDVKDALKALINWRLNGHPINFYQEAYEMCEDALKRSAAIIKVYPKLRMVEVKNEANGKTDENVEEQGGEETEKEPKDREAITEMRIDAFEPRLECVPLEDVFFDANATWKDYYKYPIVHRMVKGKDELRAAGYRNVEDAPDVNNPYSIDENKSRRSPFGPGLSSPATDGFSGTQTQPLIRKTCLYEIWTFMDLGEGLTSVVYHMLGDMNGPSMVADDPEENELPFKYSEFEPPMPPFAFAVAIPNSHRQYGYSLPIVTDALQKETNILRNQDREAAAIALRKPILYRRDAGIDVMGLVNRKISGHIAGDDISTNAVRELQVSNPIINTAAVSARNDQDYYEATSITPGQMGVSVRDETATAVSSHQANANKKIQLMVNNIVNTGLRTALWMLLRLEQAYETDATIQKVTGQMLGFGLPNDGAPTWSAIQGDHDFSIDVGMSKAQQLNKYMLLLDRINQTNVGTMQLLQSGALSSDNAVFFNPSSAFREVLSVLKMKREDFEVKAQPPAQGAEVTTPGSQPRNLSAPEQSVGQNNPEAMNELFA